MMKIVRIAGLMMALVLGLNAIGQVDIGGVPASFGFDNQEEYEILTYATPDMKSVVFEDQISDQQVDKPQRAAVPVFLNINAMDHGTWTEVEGMKIWRLGISVPEARALAVYYDRFWLPDGGELFLYNKNHKQVIGAFTSDNNDPSGMFVTELISGDLVTLEYVQPADLHVLPSIEISEVAFGYRFVDMPEFMDDDAKDASWWCMINVNCPEGNNWQQEKHGVVRQWMKLPDNYYGWCSGTLVNNTSWDLTPYVLTAGHCGEGCTQTDLNQWVFYFNYEAAQCSGNTGPETQTMNGCQKRAADESAGDDGSDFYLVELNQSVPSSYEPYFNGWDASGAGSTGGVSIHHPNGDIKKISTYTQMLQTSTFWSGLPSHWTFDWSSTVSGLSVVQGGSSGSPLFNSDGLVVGDLTGGYTSNSCETPSPVWYGKMSYSWDQNGDTPAERLKDWLDPTNTGDLVIYGTDGNVPIANFSAEPQGVSPGGSVQFADESMGNPDSWSWVFQNGVPSTSTEQNPVVTYNNYGTFDVTLTITNIFGTDTETKTDFIIVGDLPDAEFTSDVTEVTQGGQVDFQNTSTGDITSSYWQFEGGSPPQSHNSNPPMISYNTPGSYNVKLTVTNQYGQNIELKEDYITVLGAPVVDFSVDTTKTLEGGSIQFTDISSGSPDSWSWSFAGGEPATSTEQNPLVTYLTAGVYSVTLEATGPGGAADTTKVDYITVIAPASAEFSADNTVVLENEVVNFTDESTGNPVGWQWQFEGGFPDAWSDQIPPEIHYFESGLFEVSLTIMGEYNEDTETKVGFIDVGLAPEAAFDASSVLVAEGEEIDFTDLSENSPTNWNWIFTGATPETSMLQNPTGIAYLQSGSYDVTLQVSNNHGADELTVENMIHVSGVGIDEVESTFVVYPNPSNGSIYIDYSSLADAVQRVEVIDVNGRLIHSIFEIEKGNNHIVEFNNIPTGLYSVKVYSNEGVYVQKVQIIN